MSTVTLFPRVDRLVAKSWNKLAADPLSGGKYAVINSMFTGVVFRMMTIFEFDQLVSMFLLQS